MNNDCWNIIRTLIKGKEWLWVPWIEKLSSLTVLQYLYRKRLSLCEFTTDLFNFLFSTISQLAALKSSVQYSISFSASKLIHESEMEMTVMSGLVIDLSYCYWCRMQQRSLSGLFSRSPTDIKLHVYFSTTAYCSSGRFGDTWSFSTSSRIHILHMCFPSKILSCWLLIVLLCWSVMYTRYLLYVCSSWERDPSSVALPDVSSIFSPLKGFLGSFSLSKSRV